MYIEPNPYLGSFLFAWRVIKPVMREYFITRSKWPKVIIQLTDCYFTKTRKSLHFKVGTIFCDSFLMKLIVLVLDPGDIFVPPQTVTYLEPLRNVLGIVTFRLFICLFIISVEESMESVDNPLHEAAKRGNVGFLQECLNNKVNCPTCSFVVHFPLCN